MQRRLTCLVSAAFVVLALVAGCSPQPAPPSSASLPPDGSPWPEFMTIASIPGGGYAVLVGLGSLIEKELKIPTNVLEAPTGPNIELLRNKKAEVASISSVAVHVVYRGTGLYAGEKPFKSLRLLGNMQTLPPHIITMAKSRIRSVPDWRGKKIMFLTKSSPQVEMLGTRLLEFHGMTVNDVVALKWTTEEAIPSLIAGVSDLFIRTGAVGKADFLELAMSHNVVFLPMTEEEIAYVLEKEPFFDRTVIPAGIYRGQDKDVPGVGMPQMIASRTDVPADLIYEIMKIMLDTTDMDSPGRFTEFHADGGAWTLGSFLHLGTAPYHEGAVRYFKERGIWTEKEEQIQKRLLEQ